MIARYRAGEHITAGQGAAAGTARSVVDHRVPRTQIQTSIVAANGPVETPVLSRTSANSWRAACTERGPPALPCDEMRKAADLHVLGVSSRKPTNRAAAAVRGQLMRAGRRPVLARSHARPSAQRTFTRPVRKTCLLLGRPRLLHRACACCKARTLVESWGRTWSPISQHGRVKWWYLAWPSTPKDAHFQLGCMLRLLACPLLHRARC